MLSTIIEYTPSAINVFDIIFVKCMFGIGVLYNNYWWFTMLSIMVYNDFRVIILKAQTFKSVNKSANISNQNSNQHRERTIYMTKNIVELLRKNPYPGRGIILGCSEDGKRSVVYYFIMGRSENSRNRIFEKTEDGIRTAAFDESKMTDPSLIIYHPVRIYDDYTIVTNGDQTNTIADFLASGETFYTAMRTREFEPDEPNYTPRISGVVKPNGTYSLSVLKTAEGDAERCLRCFYDYSDVKQGLGHFVSTYKTDGDPLPSFEGEPIPIDMSGQDDFETFTEKIWNALNDENKVSLYARECDIATGEVKEIIKNKNVKGNA